MRKLFFILFYLIGLPNNAFSEKTIDSELVVNRKEALTDIDSLVNEALEIFHVPGAAIGVVVEGELVYAKGFGFRDLEKQLPVTIETLFAIGSCSKAFTTFILGTLVDEGVIEWDDLVIKHLPEFRLIDDHTTQKMTIRDLITHRSGLPRHDFLWYNSELSRAELLNRMQYLELTCDLREKFQYNNLMYLVAGILIEKVTGQSWEDTVKQRIFAPLEMDHSNFSIEDSKNSSNFSHPYAERKEQMQLIPFRNISNMGPAGSINSNVVDMAKWLQLQLAEGENLIQKTTLAEMHTLQFAAAKFPNDRLCPLGYGLGWSIKQYGGHYLVEHDGATDGFFTLVSLMPQEKIGVIILTNNWDGPYESFDGGIAFVSSLRKSIFDKLLGLEEIDWVERICIAQEDAKKAKEKMEDSDLHLDTHPSHNLEDYVGEYKHPGYGIVTIFLQDGQLWSIYNRIMTPLMHKHNDIFLGSEEAEDPVFADLHFSFQTCSSGGIVEMHCSLESEPIVFKKKMANELNP